MTDWDRIERLLGHDTLNQLAQKTVGVVGVGSGGGYVALALSMTGIRRFILVDDDVLDVQNIVRHVADSRAIGQPKVQAVKDLILQRNPNASVQTVQGRIEDHLELLDEMDVLVVGVDTEGAKFSLNEACLERDLVAVYAGVYERGEGGDVVIIRPYNGPCYACWANSLREGHISPAPDGSDEEMDYGQRRPDGTLAGEPGLWLDVVRVANTQANMVLNILLEGTKAERQLPANTVILANQALEILEGHITPPFSAEWVNIVRDSHCLVCGDLQSQQSELSLDKLLKDQKGKHHE
ncbi:MAG: ThiF family adenylyltransferase [Anaerolineales bacterium]|nr:ThiF family adenylyltransferase [Anaerolineales bacterium]